MRLKTLTYRLLLATIMFNFVACADKEIVSDSDRDGSVEMAGVMPTMTRANGDVDVADLKDYVGRSAFDNNDLAVFVKIKRTANAISTFSYSNIVFKCKSETSGTVTSVGWSRDMDTEKNVLQVSEPPARIYWSDATSPHTFTGYCVPQQGDGNPAFDWNEQEVNSKKSFYGSLGNPTTTEDIDFTSKLKPDVSQKDQYEASDTISGNIELRKNDILLTHSESIKADDAIAKLDFYHGLAQVRVIVNISGFAVGGGADTKSIVSNMVLKNMLTMYKWDENGVQTTSLTSDEQSALNAIYPAGSTVDYDQRKNVKLWIPDPLGVGGNNSSKTFTFYGLAVPTVIPTTEDGKLKFSFDVTYPDPMKPSVNKTKGYSASIGGIHFDSGKCTTINISLNHKNEKITVGAEYDDWEFIDTPDQGELKKNSTFLQSTERRIKDTTTGYYNVTILGDPNATADDATWLYIDNDKIKDIYGNDGSSDHPFQISTADQLLSFAYEVKGKNINNRKDASYPSGTVNSETGAFDFKNYYVALDAGITLQKSEKKSQMEMDMKKADHDSEEYKNAPATPEITWIGIGDATHNFNGVFNGGYRHINRLYGKPLFDTVGKDGVVDHIFITDAIEISGSGSIAEVNDGIICGSHVEGNIVETNYTDYCGSIVGINNGVLIACSHIGSITGNANILGALLGKNDGILVTCYNVGDAQNTATDKPAHAGVGEFTSRSVAYCCYYNGDFYTSQDYDLKAHGVIGHVAFPLTTAEMQSNKYVNQPRVEYKDAGGNVTSLSGEITDDSPKDYHSYDPFYYHWSMNAGLKRAVEFLIESLKQTPNTQDDVYFHAPGTDDTDRAGVILKKTQVQWLVNHFAKMKEVDNQLEVDEFTHQFQFIPGTYPKLK